jgi:hypothetical protein
MLYLELDSCGLLVLAIRISSMSGSPENGIGREHRSLRILC